MKERLVILFRFHGLVSIAYGTTRPRSERKTIYIILDFTVWFQSHMVRRDHVVKERLVILFRFHGLVSIAYGTTRPRCERKAGYII